MKSIQKMSYDELHNLRAEVQIRMDEIDASDLENIEATPEDFHTLETQGKVKAAKHLQKRTGCRLRTAILAINKLNGYDQDA